MGLFNSLSSMTEKINSNLPSLQSPSGQLLLRQLHLPIELQMFNLFRQPRLHKPMLAVRAFVVKPFSHIYSNHRLSRTPNDN
jgi:hypothetical protein